MKAFTFKVLLVFLVTCSHFLMAQNKMINPSNRSFSHMGESVAQYESYSLLGAYEDYENNPYTGAVYLYQNGSSSPIRSYTFDQAIYSSSYIGYHVDITDTWVAASAPKFTNSSGSVIGAIVLGKKVNSQYPTSMNYRINLNGVAIDKYCRFSISGNYLVVGAPNDNTKGSGAGAAVIYQYNSSTDQWTYLQKITASDGTINDQFGHSVAIDGNRIVVGAPGARRNTGKVYLFSKSGSTFSQTAVREYVSNVVSIDIYHHSRFGHAVDISGSTIIASAPGWPTAFDGPPVIQLVEVMEVSGSTLVSKGVFRNKGGNSVSIHGSRAVIGDVYTRDGRIHFLKKVNNNWLDYGSYIPCDVNDSDYYGHSVAVHNNNICAGIKGYDKVPSVPRNEGAGYYINFDQNAAVPVPSVSLINITPSAAQPRQYLAPEDIKRSGTFGTTIKGDDHGDLLIVGDPNYSSLASGKECNYGWGAVYIYNRISGPDSLWKYAYKIAPNYDQSSSVTPYFGKNIAYKGDFTKGHTLAITAENENVGFQSPKGGAVYIYRKTNYFNEFTYLDRVTHPVSKTTPVTGFGAGGIATNATQIVVSTPSRKELSLFQVTPDSVYHMSTINIGIEGEIQGITEGNILVVSKGATVKLYKVNTSSLASLSIPAIAPASGMQFTGKVSVDLNAMLFVMRQQLSSGYYSEALLFAELAGTQVSMTQRIDLPFALNYATTPQVKEINLKRNLGFALSFKGGFRVAVFEGAPGNYKLLDIYQLDQATREKSNENYFGNSLAYFDKELIVGDPLNLTLNNTVPTYSCHNCTSGGGFGLVHVVKINKIPGFRNNADVYRKPFAVNDAYGPKFGSSVSVNSSHVLVGSYGSNNVTRSGGSVTVYKRVAGLMLPAATLVDRYVSADYSQFGYSMDMSTDYAVISQPQNVMGGRVHIYSLANIENGFTEAAFQNPNPNGNLFGTSVAAWLNYVAVSSYIDDKVYVYRKEGSLWVLKQTITAPNVSATSSFGESIDMDNYTLVIGDPYVQTPNNTYHGRVYVYNLNTSTGLFSLASTITPNSPQNFSAFGSQVAVAGNYAAIRTPYGGTGKVSVYSKSGSTWSLLTEIVNTVPNSTTIDNISFDGTYLLMKVGGNEYVRMYQRSGSSFTNKGTFHVGQGLVSLAQNGGKFAIGVSEHNLQNHGKMYFGGTTMFNPNMLRTEDADFSVESSETISETTILYPNPSGEQWVYVTIPGEIKSVKAISVDGQSHNLTFSGNQIDIDFLPKGVYSVVIETASDVKVQKFIKY